MTGSGVRTTRIPDSGTRIPDLILGGLVTSTIRNVFLLPAIYLRYGRSAAAESASASRS